MTDAITITVNILVIIRLNPRNLGVLLYALIYSFDILLILLFNY